MTKCPQKDSVSFYEVYVNLYNSFTGCLMSAIIMNIFVSRKNQWNM